MTSPVVAGPCRSVRWSCPSTSVRARERANADPGARPDPGAADKDRPAGNAHPRLQAQRHSGHVFRAQLPGGHDDRTALPETPPGGVAAFLDDTAAQFPDGGRSRHPGQPLHPQDPKGSRAACQESEPEPPNPADLFHPAEHRGGFPCQALSRAPEARSLFLRSGMRGRDPAVHCRAPWSGGETGTT